MQIGDEVVTMSAPGRFRVAEVDGERITIENNEGVRKTVLASNLRVLRSAKGS